MGQKRNPYWYSPGVPYPHGTRHCCEYVPNPYCDLVAYAGFQYRTFKTFEVGRDSLTKVRVDAAVGWVTQMALAATIEETRVA